MFVGVKDGPPTTSTQSKCLSIYATNDERQVPKCCYYGELRDNRRATFNNNQSVTNLPTGVKDFLSLGLSIDRIEMTLREKSGPEIPPYRKCSVSHSGRFKSRPKIRPSLSGELFRPDTLEITKNNNNNNMDNGYRDEEAQPKQSPNGPSHHRVAEQVDVSGDTNSGNPQQMHQPHLQHRHSNHRQQVRPSREILETSL